MLVSFDARWNGFQGCQTLADLLNRLLDVTRVLQNPAQAIDHLGLVTNVRLHHVDGIVQNLVYRQRDGAVNGITTLLRRVRFLRNEQFQRV